LGDIWWTVWLPSGKHTNQREHRTGSQRPQRGIGGYLVDSVASERETYESERAKCSVAPVNPAIVLRCRPFSGLVGRSIPLESAFGGSANCMANQERERRRDDWAQAARMRIAGRGYKAGRFTYVCNAALPPPPDTDPPQPTYAVSKASRFISSSSLCSSSSSSVAGGENIDDGDDND
jgi:hypothetical protein